MKRKAVTFRKKRQDVHYLGVKQGFILHGCNKPFLKTLPILPKFEPH